MTSTAGDLSRVKAIANDGARTAEPVSKPFTVAGKAPVAMISGAEDGARIPRYDPLELISLAQDPEDGMLQGEPTPSGWLPVALAAAAVGTALALVTGLLVWLHRSGRLPLPGFRRRPSGERAA